MSEHNISPYIGSNEKRAFDLVVCGTLGTAALAGGVVTAALIASANRCNPVFTQTRRGKDGEEFDVIKLRTMRGDGSLLRFGEFIRNVSFDESPQFINVIQGTMSVVSYRPLLQADINLAAKTLRTHHLKSSLYHPDRWLGLRDQALPGITGPSQTMEPRSDAGSINHLTAVVASECTYLESATFATDARFVAATLGTLFDGHNPTVVRAD